MISMSIHSLTLSLESPCLFIDNDLPITSNGLDFSSREEQRGKKREGLKTVGVVGVQHHLLGLRRRPDGERNNQPHGILERRCVGRG